MSTAARILVVDDDPISLRFVVALLGGEGYEVLEAEDGEVALALVRQHHPDLVVSDLLMPYRDGYQLLRALRSDESLMRIPVILLSMKDREDEIVRGFDEGADDYVIKPFHARELVARVRRLLERGR